MINNGFNNIQLFQVDQLCLALGDIQTDSVAMLAMLHPFGPVTYGAGL